MDGDFQRKPFFQFFKIFLDFVVFNQIGNIIIRKLKLLYMKICIEAFL